MKGMGKLKGFQGSDSDCDWKFLPKLPSLYQEFSLQDSSRS
jgi:hypothetical protein